MNCSKCGTPLINTYVCPNCGQKDELARKIIYASNRHYNQGLEKTKVRDLSGATNSLLMSLKYNKRNTQARNLLGLVYYQTGEIVNALGEWVISVHFQPENNAANTYIKEIQNNPGKLAKSNRIIKKYNRALEYLDQGNMDMAIVELKKTINLNPNYVKAYQLLGLLYFQTKQYASARKILVRSLKIDRNNLTSLKYIKEIDAIAGNQARVKQKEGSDSPQIHDPNPVIVEDKKELKYTDFNTGMLSIVNVVIGVVIGVAVACLLVVPSVKRSQALEYNQSIVEYSSKLTENSKLIASYENENEELEEELEVLQGQLEGDEGTLSSNDEAFYAAISEYLAGESSTAGLSLAEVDPDSIENEDALSIYTIICEATSSDAITTLAAEGYASYTEEDYLSAIESYEKVLNLDEENTEALYYVGASYQNLADLENAVVYYEQLLELDTESELAIAAQEAVDEINAQSGQTGEEEEE